MCRNELLIKPTSTPSLLWHEWWCGGCKTCLCRFLWNSTLDPNMFWEKVLVTRTEWTDFYLRENMLLCISLHLTCLLRGRRCYQVRMISRWQTWLIWEARGKTLKLSDFLYFLLSFIYTGKSSETFIPQTVEEKCSLSVNDTGKRGDT